MTWQQSTDTATEGHLNIAPDFTQQATKISFAALVHQYSDLTMTKI